jgi:hypothetical protein
MLPAGLTGAMKLLGRWLPINGNRRMTAFIIKICGSLENGC